MNKTRATGIIIGSIEATALAGWVAYTSDVPFGFAFPFFVICRPVATVVGAAFAKNDPISRDRPHVAAVAARIIVLPAMAAVLTEIWVWWTRAPFLPAYSYCLMACAGFGAVQGIVMDWEDNRPGGWLNPHGDK